MLHRNLSGEGGNWSYNVSQQQDNIPSIKEELILAFKNNYVATGKEKESSSIKTGE